MTLPLPQAYLCAPTGVDGLVVSGPSLSCSRESKTLHRNAGRLHGAGRIVHLQTKLEHCSNDEDTAASKGDGLLAERSQQQ